MCKNHLNGLHRWLGASVDQQSNGWLTVQVRMQWEFVMCFNLVRIKGGILSWRPVKKVTLNSIRGVIYCLAIS